MANPYALFMNLLPKQMKFIGIIYQVSPTGDVEVTPVHSSTTRIKVKGGSDSFTVGDYVMISDGIIISKLPNVQTILQKEVI